MSATSEPARKSRFAVNPIVIMIGVGLVMLGAIAVASTFKQSATDSLATRSVGTGQLVPLGESVGDPLQVGATAPEFALEDLNGRTVTLASLRGKPTVLNFWATWCPPCRAEMPEFQAVSQRHPELALVGVNLREPPGQVGRFVAGSFTWTFLLDATAAVSRQYAIAALPTTLFIDADGVIRQIRVGGMSGKEINERVDALISNQPYGGQLEDQARAATPFAEAIVFGVLGLALLVYAAYVGGRRRQTDDETEDDEE